MSPAGELLLAFALGGGMPPATSVLLRIHQDGSAVALVGHAPESARRDEAGLYRMELPAATLRELETFLAGHRLFREDKEHGPRQPDSGFTVLRVYRDGKETRIRWGDFATVPPPLAELRERLLGILDEARQHPVQTVQVRLEPDAPQRPGEPWRLRLSLINRGTHGVRIPVQPGAGAVRLLATPVGPDTNLEESRPLDRYRRAKPLPAPETPGWQAGRELLPVATAGGPFLILEAAAPPLGTGRVRLEAFLDLAIEVTLEGAALPLTTSIYVPPVEVDVK